MWFELKNQTILSAISLITFTTSLTLRGTEIDFDSDAAKKLIKLSKSADIKSYMDINIDPCDDFYSYACGTWKRINPAELIGSRTHHFDITRMGIEQKINNLLFTNKTGNNEVENKIKDFYTSCLNTKADIVKYRLALKNFQKEIGKFSVFKTSEEKNQTKWWSTVAKIKNKYGISLILSPDIVEDFKDKSKPMVLIQPPGNSALNIQDVQINRIQTFLELFFNVEEQDANRMAKEIIDFDNDLMSEKAIKYQAIESWFILYNTTDLEEKFKDLLDLQEFLKIVLNTKDLPAQMYIFDESYFKNLLNVFNRTDKEVINNYILWRFLDDFIIDITWEDIKNTCVSKSRKHFAKYIDHALYQQYRSKEVENDIYVMWNDIKSTFQNDLKSSKYYWISNATRQHAIKKLKNMKFIINSYDNINFNEHYKDLVIDPLNYVDNVQNILQHANSLRVNKSEEGDHVMSYTPFYKLDENYIKVPVSMLQPRFIWDRNYPKSIQYSTLGAIIAHELFHGFDDIGRGFDADSNYNSWWDEKSLSAFETRRKCFQEQYQNYSYYGKRLPESTLQSENIADCGALNLAYNAYLRWLEKRKQTEMDVEANETLPRLDFNNHQLFFITFAQTLCEDILSEYRSSFYDQDFHSPSMFRIIGPLSNSREFSWIFKCNKHTSPMNPPKKCEMY